MGAANECSASILGVSAYKRKAHMLIGGLLAAVGLGGMFGALFAGERTGFVLPALGVIGLAYYLVARARAWWHHG